MAVADLILDNSVAMRWALPRSNSPEAHRYADAVLERLEAGATALVPNLWHVEAVSVLVRAEKKGLIDAAGTGRFLSFTAALGIETDDRPASHTVASLARTYGLSGYDAQYLDLAMRSGLPLATVDEALGRAATEVGVVLYLGGI